MELEKTFQNILNKTQVQMSSGQAGVGTNSDGAKRELMTRLQCSLTTTDSERGEQPEGSTGQRVLTHGSARIPPELPAKLAEECMTKRLPPCVQSWLTDMERHGEIAPSVGGNPPNPPSLDADEMMMCRSELAVLEQILAPAHTKGEELVMEVSTFFSMLPYQKGDESEKRLKINGWCDLLEDYPLYAIRRALRWWLKFGKEEPQFSQVVDDVVLFTGTNVLNRKKLLEKLV